MVTKLMFKNSSYYCNNCRLTIQGELPLYCPFCGYEFSNWEEVMIEIVEARYKEENNASITTN